MSEATGLREALEFLNGCVQSGAADSQNDPYYVATNYLLGEIARREDVSLKYVIEEFQR